MTPEDQVIAAFVACEKITSFTEGVGSVVIENQQSETVKGVNVGGRKSLLAAVEENTAQLRAVCAELRAMNNQKKRKVETTRAKTLGASVRSKSVVISDIAAASAKRALQKLGR